MRFVSPETVRIDLPSGDWIDIKRELSNGDEQFLIHAGLKKASAGGQEVDIDWSARANALIEVYLVRWSAVDDKGKPVAVSRSAINALATEDCNEIKAAIVRHQSEMAEAKKAQSGTPTLTVA